VVLTAKVIRPDYRSGETFRHVVLAGGIVRALANTAAEAARAAGSAATWVDLGPACVGPGFIDTHIHALQAAADARLVSLRETTTLAGLLEAVRDRGAGREPGAWTVTGRNWQESQLREGRLPGRAELDALDIPGPVMVRRGSHVAVLNSRAAALLGVDNTGPVHDAVIARALEMAGEPSRAERSEDLATILARFNARGITSIREAGVDADGLDLFLALRDQGRLSMRCDLLWRVAEGSDTASARRQLAGMPSVPDSPYARLTGVKAFVDGRIADAATERSDAIALRMTPAELWAVIGESLRRTSGMACHAVGDRAVRMVLDAYERALAAGLAREPRRLVIEHALDCAPETIRRIAASGVGVSIHPSIVYEFAGEIRQHWGEHISGRAAPVRDMVAAGVRMAAGSDGDVPPFDPLRGIWFMVTRQGRTGGPVGAGQAVARDVALDLYTRRGADLLGAGGRGGEQRRGELRPGMDADLAAFTADPLMCPVDELPDTEIILTLLGGRAVHDPARLMEEAGPDG
jgi:predicted amidohydrolase YtcJ